MPIDLSRLSPDAQRQIIQKLCAQKRQKYGNEKTARGDIRFDSKAEARRYDELMLMLKSGTIRDLKLQPEYTLLEAYTTPDGKRIRAERYRADFSYRIRFDGRQEWPLVVEDVKSKATKTSIYKSKKKRILEKYRIEIKEVTF